MKTEKETKYLPSEEVKNMDEYDEYCEKCHKKVEVWEHREYGKVYGNEHDFEPITLFRGSFYCDDCFTPLVESIVEHNSMTGTYVDFLDFKKYIEGCLDHYAENELPEENEEDVGMDLLVECRCGKIIADFKNFCRQGYDDRGCINGCIIRESGWCLQERELRKIPINCPTCGSSSQQWTYSYQDVEG